MQDSDKHPHYDALKTMLASGRPIPIKLDLLAQLESRFAAAKGWVDRAARTFIKKNSNIGLLEVRVGGEGGREGGLGGGGGGKREGGRRES